VDNITTIVQMLTTHVKQALASDYNLMDIEQVTRQVLQEVGRQTVAAVVKAEAERYPASELSCPHCGSMMSYVRQRTAQLRTLLGCVAVKRAYYLCSACHRGSCPLDQRLGLRPNALSAELERLAAMTGVQLPFEKGRDLFEALTLVSLSDQTMDKATQAYGAKVVADETAWRTVAYDQAALQQRKRTERRPLRLYGALDATKVHTHGQDDHPWRDLKVGAWFEARGRPPSQPDGQWRIQAENIHYYADICSAAEFGHLLWTTGVQHNAQLAQELVILGDGADWIWMLVAEHFPHAVQILDWFHASEYLMPVAKAAFATPVAQQQWLQQTKQALWDGALDAVIDACLDLVRTEDSSDPAFVAARYFDQNRSRMDYPTYRQQGYQIGSGTIESAAKQIGLLRMKVAGAIWNVPSARLVAKARAAYLSHRWDELAAYHALPLVS
jgi:hypothetical protein